MNKIMTKLSGLFLGLAMMVGVGAGVSTYKVSEAKAASDSDIVLSFASGTNDSTKSSTSDTAAGLFQTDSQTYVSGKIVTATNVYAKTSNYLRIGNSSASGTLKFNLSSSYDVTTVVVKAKRYNTNKASTIKFNGSAECSLPTDGSYKECQFDVNSSISSIELFAKYYLYVESITLNISDTTIELKSITGIEGTLEATRGDSAWDLSGLTPIGILSNDTTKEVDISNYVTLSTDDVPGSAGDTTVSVTVTPKAGSVTAKLFDVDATVLETPIYSNDMSDYTWPGSTGTVYANSLITESSGDGKAWRLSSSEFFSSSGTQRMLGDYSSSNNGKWDKFAGIESGAVKYYASIASTITQDSYGFAMYSQNFVINKAKKITFAWTGVSGLSGTSNAYIVVSTNGGYSWSKLANVSGLGTNKEISWSGNNYESTDNILVGLAFTSSTQNGQLRNISWEIYGESIAKKNVWAVREVSISGNENVEAEKSITLTASTVTIGYETPANSNITWESSNNSVATVNGGVVTGVATGSVTITAKAADGHGAQTTKNISVTPKLRRIDHIELDTTSVQKTFVRNSSFNSNGLVVTVYYSNGFDPETVTPTSVVPPTMSVAGENLDVTVTYSLNGTSDSETYKIDITPIVSSSLTISGDGISLNEQTGRYSAVIGPNSLIDVVVGYNGDEETYSASTSNEKIYIEDDVLVGESTVNDTATITLTCGNATVYLDVTLVADESYTTDPADGILSGIVHQQLDFSVNLLNATSANWSASTSEYYEISGTGSISGYDGKIELKKACENLAFTLSVTTSKDTYEISFSLTATEDSITAISVKTNPSKTTYVVGESFNSSGLVIQASRSSGVPTNLSSSEYTLDNPSTFTYRGTVTITVSLVADSTKKCSFNVTVNMPTGLKILVNEQQAGKYQKVTSAPQSWEGNYLVVYEIPSATDSDSITEGYTWTGVDAGQCHTDVSINNGSIEVNDIGDGAVTLDITAIDGGYSISFTIESNTSFIGTSSDANSLKIQDTAILNIIGYDSTNKCVDISSNGAHLRYNSNSGTSNERFRYYKSSSYTSQGKIQLYKYVPGEFGAVEHDVSETLYDFIISTNNCGTTNYSTLTSWDDAYNATLNPSYGKLTSTDKLYLKNGLVSGKVNGVDKQSWDMFASFITSYDRAVASGCYNYLERGPINSSRLNPILALNNVDNSVWIIAVIAFTGLTAIGGYFFYRKRKEI